MKLCTLRPFPTELTDDTCGGMVERVRIERPSGVCLPWISLHFFVAARLDLIKLLFADAGSGGNRHWSPPSRGRI